MRATIGLQHALVFEQRLAGNEAAPAPITTRDVLEYATVEGARANGLADPRRGGAGSPCLAG
jgi:cytosine/adenosine deaminase-related metal-dependent hydrolase